MKKGQRPRQHIRRVVTNSGRKPTQINKGVKFKSYATPSTPNFRKGYVKGDSDVGISSYEVKVLNKTSKDSYLVQEPDGSTSEYTTNELEVQGRQPDLSIESPFKSQFKTTQSSSTFEKREFVRDKGFGKKLRSYISLYKTNSPVVVKGNPGIRYNVSSNVYDTKQIGIDKKSEGLLKVYRNRIKTFNTYKGAKNYINREEKLIQRKY